MTKPPSVPDANFERAIAFLTRLRSEYWKKYLNARSEKEMEYWERKHAKMSYEVSLLEHQRYQE